MNSIDIENLPSLDLFLENALKPIKEDEKFSDDIQKLTRAFLKKIFEFYEDVVISEFQNILKEEIKHGKSLKGCLENFIDDLIGLVYDKIDFYINFCSKIKSSKSKCDFVDCYRVAKLQNYDEETFKNDHKYISEKIAMLKIPKKKCPCYSESLLDFLYLHYYC